MVSLYSSTNILNTSPSAYFALAASTRLIISGLGRAQAFEDTAPARMRMQWITQVFHFKHRPTLCRVEHVS